MSTATSDQQADTRIVEFAPLAAGELLPINVDFLNPTDPLPPEVLVASGPDFFVIATLDLSIAPGDTGIVVVRKLLYRIFDQQQHDLRYSGTIDLPYTGVPGRFTSGTDRITIDVARKRLYFISPAHRFIWAIADYDDAARCAVAYSRDVFVGNDWLMCGAVLEESGEALVVLWQRTTEHVLLVFYSTADGSFMAGFDVLEELMRSIGGRPDPSPPEGTNDISRWYLLSDPDNGRRPVIGRLARPGEHTLYVFYFELIRHTTTTFELRFITAHDRRRFPRIFQGMDSFPETIDVLLLPSRETLLSFRKPRDDAGPTLCVASIRGRQQVLRCSMTHIPELLMSANQGAEETLPLLLALTDSRELLIGNLRNGFAAIPTQRLRTIRYGPLTHSEYPVGVRRTMFTMFMLREYAQGLPKLHTEVLAYIADFL